MPCAAVWLATSRSKSNDHIAGLRSGAKPSRNQASAANELVRREWVASPSKICRTMRPSAKAMRRGGHKHQSRCLTRVSHKACGCRQEIQPRAKASLADDERAAGCGESFWQRVASDKHVLRFLHTVAGEVDVAIALGGEPAVIVELGVLVHGRALIIKQL